MNIKLNTVAVACISLTALLGLTGCVALPVKNVGAVSVERSIDDEIVRIRTQAQAIASHQAQTAILMDENQRVQMLAQLKREPRFDLLLTNAPAKDVFLSLVAGTTWSLTLHPGITGTVSTTLRRVTLREALDALSDMHGFEYRIEGSRISVFPPTLRTRNFVVDYLTSTRVGQSDARINSGNSSAAGASGAGGAAGAGGGSSTGTISTQVQTSSTADLWKEMGEAIRAMVQEGEGKHVLLTPQASLITVRATPEELRKVEEYLNTVRGAVQRQVMLEAKIIDVELSDNFQSGVQWNRLFSPGNTDGAIGRLTQNTGIPNLPSDGVNIPGLVSLPGLSSNAFGLSLASTSFEMLLSFLESFGTTKVLSSPRVATMNNQRALLKVGTDEFFITSATPGSAVSTGTDTPTVNPPTLNWASFFSGISLDVTPQIDNTNNVTMHIRPSVTSVQERIRELNLGTAGNYRLPTATNRVNETDTVVRIPDGHIVAIGGLMHMESDEGASGLPGAENAGIFRSLLSNNRRTSRKRELVVLIRPTVIKQNKDWASTWDKASLLMQIEPTKVIRIEGTRSE